MTQKVSFVLQQINYRKTNSVLCFYDYDEYMLFTYQVNDNPRRTITSTNSKTQMTMPAINLTIPIKNE